MYSKVMVILIDYKEEENIFVEKFLSMQSFRNSLLSVTEGEFEIFYL